MSWSRLIRFLDDEDQVCLGDAVANSAQDLVSLLEAGSLTAEKLAGNDIFDAKPTGKIVKVKSLLGPLTPRDVPILRCVGLNYAKHSTSSPSFFSITLHYILTIVVKETGRAPPPHPTIFIKPSSSITGWNDGIPIPKIAQKDQLDYEGELVCLSTMIQG